MTAPRILIHNAETDHLAKTLRARFPDLTVRGCNSFAELGPAITDFRPDVVYTVRFTTAEPFPRDALFGPGGPRWIANGGAGTDHLSPWDPSRVTVTNSAGVAAGMMAEYMLGGFLHFLLDVPGLRADARARHWNHARKVRPLAGKTLLIVGLGHTGVALARRAKALGLRVIGTRARPQAVENVDEVFPADKLTDILPQADLIAVCTPLTPATRGLIGADQFAAMQRGVLFADVSRGGVTDQTALAQALRSGIVGGAAIDVFETEPLPSDSPMWDLPNTLISPHCSSVSEGWDTASFDLFLDNLDGWIAGRPLFNVVDPARGY